MNNYVLFSPIGLTDPIRQEHDGPMLHIIRHYKPKKVYLYFTKEMKNKKDEIIKALSPFSIEYEEIITDIENAHDFDIFAEEFDKILVKIQEDNKESKILLNITSGTAQMLSALCLEVVTSHLELKPIQVITPMLASNTGVSFGGSVDNNLDDLKEEDGTYLEPNRCIEPNILSFRKSALKRSIITLIKNYDYSAAYEIAKANEFLFNKNVDYNMKTKRIDTNKGVLELIRYALLRHNDNKGYLSFLWHKEFDYTKDLEAKRACDYYCILKNTAKTGELSYFVLLLKPLIEYIAKCYIGEFTDNDVEEGLNRYYLNKNGNSYRPEIYKGKVVYNIEQYIEIMIIMQKPEGVISKFKEIMLYLKKRNSLAHGLIRVDDFTESDINKVLNVIKYIMKKTFKNKMKDPSLELYERINEKIIEML